jgi:hypothetical protein
MNENVIIDVFFLYTKEYVRKGGKDVNNLRKSFFRKEKGREDSFSLPDQIRRM